MDVLTKVRSATLVEALVATVLIVIVFVVASLILNNLLLNTFSKNTHPLDTRINELQYHIRCGQIKLPYEETFKNFDISVRSATPDYISIEATDNRTGKQFINTQIDAR